MKNCSPGLQELLLSMLELNPYFRSSIKECLNFEIFDAIRVRDLEEDAPWKIHLDVDQEDAFNYDNVDQSPYNINDYRKKIIKEINKLHRN